MTGKIHPVKLPFTLQVNENVSVERFVNFYIVTGEQLAIVDTGVAASLPAVADALAEMGRSLEDVEWVVNTHAHPDHAGGNHLLKEKINPKFVCHEKAVRWIENMDLQAQERPLYKFDTLVSGSVEVARKLQDGDELDLGDVTLRAIFTPGHAPGLMSLYCPQEGALLCADSIPPTQGLPLYYDLAQSRESIQRLAEVPDVDVLYHSHVEAPHSGPDIARAFQDGLDFLDRMEEIVSKVAEELGSDASVEDITRESLGQLGFEHPPVIPLTVATIRAHLGS